MTNKEKNLTNAANSSTQQFYDYDGRPLEPNEVLVSLMMGEEFIRANVTNPDSIVHPTIGGKTVTAVLVAVDKSAVKIAKQQFNYDQNEEFGHYGHRMDYESIEDREERELPEYGQSPSAASIVYDMELLMELMTTLIEKAPQLALASLLKLYGTEAQEFEERMHLAHNGANKAIRKAEEAITQMLSPDGDISVLPVKVNKTKNDDYYRAESKLLLDLIIRLYY